MVSCSSVEHSVDFTTAVRKGAERQTVRLKPLSVCVLRGFALQRLSRLFLYCQSFSFESDNPASRLFYISSAPCYTPTSAHFHSREPCCHFYRNRPESCVSLNWKLWFACSAWLLYCNPCSIKTGGALIIIWRLRFSCPIIPPLLHLSNTAYGWSLWVLWVKPEK